MWLEIKEKEILPVWYIDVDGLTRYTVKEEHLLARTQECAELSYPGSKIEVREWRPSPEEWDNAAQVTRDARRWNSGFGAPARPWPLKDSLTMPGECLAGLEELKNKFGRVRQ